MPGLLEGKVALITGTSTGIGRASAIEFAKEGAKVVAASRNEEANGETVRMIRDQGGEAIAVRADVTIASDVEALVKKAVDTYGRLDCAFNNAGVPSTPAPLFDQTEEDFDATIRVNLKGVWLCMKYEIRQMLAQGGGAIVNMSSMGGLIGMRGIAGYTASKHGVLGLTKTAALELATTGIRVNAVCPGGIRGTVMIEWLVKERPEIAGPLLASHPMGRGGQPAEVAAAVVWLCSSNASFITGHALPIDGGTFAGR